MAAVGPQLRGKGKQQSLPLLLSLGVDNMTDAGDPQYLPIQPRSYYLEVSWSL